MRELGEYGAGDLQTISARNRIEQDYNNRRLNLNYEGKLDTLGTKITANLDYIQLSKDLDSYFTNNYFFIPEDQADLEQLFNRSISDYEIFAAQTDLEIPLNERSQISMGVKGSKVISKSNLRFYWEKIPGENSITPVAIVLLMKKNFMQHMQVTIID